MNIASPGVAKPRYSDMPGVQGKAGAAHQQINERYKISVEGTRLIPAHLISEFPCI